MKVAVVTPYCREPLDVLRRCHDSVARQRHGDVFHVMVADGYPREEIDGWRKVLHVKTPPHDDFGDTPRAIGALTASSHGAEAIALLDADCWFEPNHLATLCQLQRLTGVPVVTATRMLYRPDGRRLGVCKESNGKTFNDTNCYLLTPPTFPIFSAWGFKKPADGIVGDRVFWDAVRQTGLNRAHCPQPTVNYVTNFVHHYRAFGETPPPDAKLIVWIEGEPHRRLTSFAEHERLGLNQAGTGPGAAGGVINPPSAR